MRLLRVQVRFVEKCVSVRRTRSHREQGGINSRAFSWRINGAAWLRLSYNDGTETGSVRMHMAVSFLYMSNNTHQDPFRLVFVGQRWKAQSYSHLAAGAEWHSFQWDLPQPAISTRILSG